MSGNFLRFFVIVAVLSFAFALKYLQEYHRLNFSLLINFTCTTSNDELEKYPEMRTIVLVELENKFPPGFSLEVLKCLPQDVNKIILNPHEHFDDNSTLILPKESMVIYVADVVRYNPDNIFTFWFKHFKPNFPPIHHLSKHLIISSNKTKIKRTRKIFNYLLNVVQIYESNSKVVARTFDRTRNLTTTLKLRNSDRENLSQILYPDRTKDLNGLPLYAYWIASFQTSKCKNCIRPNYKWSFFLDVIAERMNATFKYFEMSVNVLSENAYLEQRRKSIRSLNIQLKLDFYLSDLNDKFDLTSYDYNNWCYQAPLPDNISITDQILFLPMDKSCWMWLGVTVFVSTLVWRISEGHWSFPFGIFSYFTGQSQLIIRIQTNRPAMKILLQLLIFSIFIFSNGYQSIVTSFMLDPLQVPLLKTVEEVFASDLNIKHYLDSHRIYARNQKYQKAFQDGRVKKSGSYFPYFTSDQIEYSKNKNLATLTDCKNRKYLIKRGNEKSWQGLYLIEEVAVSNPSDLYTRPLHPYIDKFQHFMDRTLEAGLHQAWETFFYLKRGEKYRIKEKPLAKNSLDFGLIAPFFLILAFGFGAATLALFCEIFFHDFVSQLTKEFWRRKFDEIFRREIKVEKKLKVKITQVRPKQEQESVL